MGYNKDMEEKEDQKIGFWKWFFSKKWVVILFWIFVLITSSLNQVELLSSDPFSLIVNAIYGTLGYIIFVLIMFTSWFFLVTNRKRSQKLL